MSTSFSVLMSIYHKENPEWFRCSINSIFNQTVLPAEIVLVEDGELPKELENVVLEYENKCDFLKVVRFKDNRGLGMALRDGLLQCSYNLVARMDTDDIALANRFGEQLKVFEKYPEIDVCSAWVSEFVDAPDNIVAIKKLPELPQEIFKYGKSRNPINHPVSMFKKDAVLKAGNYQHCPLAEDYWLWGRMLAYGFKFYNVQKPLLLFRTSSDMYSRRGGAKYFKTEISLLRRFKSIGYIDNIQFIKNLIMRSIVRVIPNSLRGWIYRKLLREKA